MSQATVQLTCKHIIATTGDLIQPIRRGALRWCGACKAWRQIERSMVTR